MKNKILESTYETIKESVEWGIDKEDSSYGYFIDGIIALAETLLANIESVES